MPRPITSGVLLAIASAVAFGLTTPVIAWSGGDAGPLTTAALLYAGTRPNARASPPEHVDQADERPENDAYRITAWQQPLTQ